GRRQNTMLNQFIPGGLAQLGEVQAGVGMGNQVVQAFDYLLADIVVRGEEQLTHGDLDLAPLHSGEDGFSHEVLSSVSLPPPLFRRQVGNWSSLFSLSASRPRYLPVWGYSPSPCSRSGWWVYRRLQPRRRGRFYRTRNP